MTVSQRGSAWTMAKATPSNSMTQQGTWPTGSTQTAKDLLVAVVSVFGTSTVATFTCSTSKWAQVVSSATTTVNTTIWVKIAAGSDTAPTFAATTTGTTGDQNLSVTLFDLYDSSGETPSILCTGTATGTSGGTISPKTNAGGIGNTGIIGRTGSFGIAAAIIGQGTTSASTTWSTPTFVIAADQTTTSYSQAVVAYAGSLGTGSTQTVTFTHGRTTTYECGAIIVACPPASAKIATFTDSFATNDMATNWANSFDYSGTFPSGSNIVWSAGPLFGASPPQVALATGSIAGEYNQLISTNYYDLTASSVYIKIAAALPDANNDRTFDMILAGGAGAFVYIGYYGGKMLMAMGDGSVSGPWTTTLTYNATNHLWVRIREASGVIYWDTAPDGVTWTSQGNYTYMVPVTCMTINVEAFYTGTDTNSTAIVSNLNSVTFFSNGSLALKKLAESATCGGGNTTSTGTLGLKKLAEAGTVTETFSSSGGLGLKKLAESGTSAETFSSTGTLGLKKLAETGAAHSFNATGTLGLKKLAESGSALAGNTTSGTLAAKKLS